MELSEELRALNRELHGLLHEAGKRASLATLLAWIREKTDALRVAAAMAGQIPARELLVREDGAAPPGCAPSTWLERARFLALSATWRWTPVCLGSETSPIPRSSDYAAPAGAVLGVMADLHEFFGAFGGLVLRSAAVRHPHFGPLQAGQWVRLFRIGARAAALGADFPGKRAI